MKIALPTEPEVIVEMRGAQIRLPPRLLGPLRNVGHGLLIFGIFTTAFMIFWMSGPIGGFLRDKSDHPFRYFQLIFGLFGLPGLAIGLVMFVAGIAVLGQKTHAVITIKDGAVAVTEHIGPLRWTRRKSAGDEVRFVIHEIRGKDGKAAGDQFCALSIETPGKPWLVTLAYPRELLRSVTEKISAALPQARLADGHAEAPVRVEITELAPGVTLGDHYPEVPQPAGSKAVQQQIPGGIGITFPPRGLLKGSGGFFLFSLAWLAFCGVFFVLAFLGRAKTEPAGAAIAMLLVFPLVGIAMLCVSVHLGRRKVVIVALADKIAIKRISPFGKKEWIVARDDIGDIRIGPSGVEVNDRPVLQLQIIPTRGEKVGILGGSSDDELRWLAGLLRKQYGIASAPQHQPSQAEEFMRGFMK